MITLLKLVAAAGIAWGVLSPTFTPRAEDCSCSGSADVQPAKFVPRADGCSCRADVD